MYDKIYDDFKNELLPKLGESINITKDYFYDLFNRFIHFLIIKDSIYLIVSIALLTLFSKLIDKENETELNLILTICWIISFIFICINIWHLLQDFLIPEVRIYNLYY